MSLEKYFTYLITLKESFYICVYQKRCSWNHEQTYGIRLRLNDLSLFMQINLKLSTLENLQRP